MPLRVVVLFRFGPPFGGFRAALRAQYVGLDGAETFRVLEETIGKVYSLLEPHAPEDWELLVAEDLRVAVPRLGNREGGLSLARDARTGATGEVLVCADLPFRAWPLGSWAIYEGWHRGADGTWTPFSEEELNEIW